MFLGGGHGPPPSLWLSERGAIRGGLSDKQESGRSGLSISQSLLIEILASVRCRRRGEGESWRKAKLCFKLEQNQTSVGAQKRFPLPPPDWGECWNAVYYFISYVCVSHPHPKICETPIKSAFVTSIKFSCQKLGTNPGQVFFVSQSFFQ